MDPNARIVNNTDGQVKMKLSLNNLIRPEHMIGGLAGGVVSTVLLHPLDLLKVRFAVSDGRTRVPQYTSLITAIKIIHRDEGTKGFFKGLSANVVGCGLSWGLYFFYYNGIKLWMQNGDPTVRLGPSKHMQAAAAAGAVTLLLTNPIWVVKTRLCLQYGSNVESSVKYKGLYDCYNKINRLEGFAALYKGLLPGLFGVSHGAIQFMVYEELKSRYNQQRDLPITVPLGTLEYILFAASSKLIAASITYPYQVIRSRLQDQHRQYKGMKDCVIKTYVKEGWKGFYKGLTPNLIRVVPATVITFLVYENISSMFSTSWRLFDDDDK